VARTAQERTFWHNCRIESDEGKGVQERAEAAGASSIDLPPDSPEMNPIEQAWFKLKTQHRPAKERAEEALDQAISDWLPNITAEGAIAF
jgi:transposase